MLTERQIEVLQLFANGHNYKGAALALDISPQTIKNHMCDIYSRLGVSGQMQAVMYGAYLGLIDLEQAKAEAAKKAKRADISWG